MQAYFSNGKKAMICPDAMSCGAPCEHKPVHEERNSCYEAPISGSGCPAKCIGVEE